jgi:hypothetical protein
LIWPPSAATSLWRTSAAGTANRMRHLRLTS